MTDLVVGNTLLLGQPYTPAADLLHGEETVLYEDADYQGIEKREEM